MASVEMANQPPESDEIPRVLLMPEYGGTTSQLHGEVIVLYKASNIYPLKETKPACFLIVY